MLSVMRIMTLIMRHSGARAKPGNPESSHSTSLWIPGPALCAVPE